MAFSCRYAPVCYTRRMDYQRNFLKTLEIIGTVFALKKAYIRTQHPTWTDDLIDREINRQILKRKEDAWESRTGCLKPLKK